MLPVEFDIQECTGYSTRWRRELSTLTTLAAVVAMLLSSCATPLAADSETTAGQTTVAKWQDGKKAVYLLSFDDNAPSQLENVIPELDRREIAGTFYVVPGNDLWAATEERWVEAAASPFVTLANHTFTHRGVNNAEDLETELEQSNDILYRIYANRSQPFLLSFGQPGGVPWNVSAEEYAAALKRHNLLERPPFRGSPMNYPTQEDLVASVDEAISIEGLGYNDMHGVGGDWLSTPVEWFIALLDKLEAEKSQVWIADVASYDEYVTERQTARVDVLTADANGIRLELTSSADQALYNYPLTLKTKVPVGWTKALVTQGASENEVLVIDGQIMYRAVPGAEQLQVTPR